MSRVWVARLAIGLLALAVSACSRGSAPDVAFIPTRAVEDVANNPKAAFESAKAVCLEEARRKGISSVTRLLLLRGKTSKSDYIECMERKGFAEIEE